MGLTKKYFILFTVSISLSIFSVILFVYLNINSSIIYVSKIISNIMMIFLFIRILKKKQLVFISCVLLLSSIYIMIKSNNGIEHMDVYTEVISKKETKEHHFFIQINNFGELSDEPLSLKINKKDYEKISIGRKKYLITYRNFNLKQDINITQLEDIKLD